jgi:hypothetical protein
MFLYIPAEKLKRRLLFRECIPPVRCKISRVACLSVLRYIGRYINNYCTVRWTQYYMYIRDCLIPLGQSMCTVHSDIMCPRLEANKMPGAGAIHISDQISTSNLHRHSMWYST